jgi:DNA-binding CsgD family transcriptional regulator
VSGRFVGRDQELQELGALASDVLADGQPLGASIDGPPGSGKTRLLQEVIQRSSLRVMRINGYEPEHAVPLTAARGLLRELSRSPGSGRRLAAIAFGARSWGSASPLRLFEAAYRCVAGLCPLGIAVDDVQWMDAMSLALLSYLIRAAEADRAPLLILAAGRPSATLGSMRDALAGTLPAARVREVSLEPLTAAAGVALVRGIAPATDAAAAQRIWERAGGSPFWIEALTVDADPLGPSLARRFAALGDDAASVLGCLSIVARPAQSAELAAALAWPPDRIKAAVVELIARGLAMERSGAIGAAHDLVREAARRQLPDEVARRLHARLARHLEDLAEDDVQRLQEALDHAIAGNVPALGIALRVAVSPQRRLIGVDGVRRLGGLARGADRLDPMRARLEAALAELSTELGDRALESESWLAVAERATGAELARAWYAAAKATYRLGDRPEASRLIALARAVPSPGIDVAIALDALEASVLRWLAHRTADARRLTARSLAAATDALVRAADSGSELDPRLRAAVAEAFQAAYDLALQEGGDREQIAVAERLLDLADGEFERMEAQLLLTAALRRAGRLETAERLARRVRDEASRRLYPALTVTAGHHLARALYALGRLREAEQVASDAERLSARIGETGRFLSEIRSLRPGIAVGRGDWRSGVDQLRADIEREPDPHYQLGIHQEIATWLARLGGPGAAMEVRARLASAEACRAAVDCPRCGRELTLRGAAALARIGDHARARAALTSSVLGEARRSTEGRVFLSQAIGALRLVEGPPERAIPTLERLSRRLAEHGFERERLWADLDRATAWEGVDRDAAIALYRSVADRAAAGGVLTDVHVARQRLRVLGARLAPPRHQAGPLGLSVRELEIARLAAAGASNPEIAATLFLSRKTVERHVSVALEKTGARNRTQLAARLAAAEGARVDEGSRELPDTTG